MMEPIDRHDPLEHDLRDGGTAYRNASEGLVGDLDDVRERSHRQTVAFRLTAASLTAVIVLVGVVGLTRGRGTQPPTQFDSAAGARSAPSSSSMSTTTSVPVPAPLPTEPPGSTSTTRTPTPPTTIAIPPEAETTTTTGETPPPTDLPPEPTVPPTTAPTAAVAPTVASVQLRGDGLALVAFGDDADLVMSKLAAAFGSPTADTSWVANATDPVRKVSWGDLTVVLVDDGTKRFTAWTYGSNVGGYGSPKVLTPSGITLGTTGDTFNTIAKPTINNSGSMCFVDRGEVCANLSPPTTSGLFADPDSRVVRLAAGDAP